MAMKIISGTANPELSEMIAKKLRQKLTDVTIQKFADGETYVRINDGVRGDDVFIIQSMISNDAIMELLIMLDAVKRASANRIVVVLPYYGYARQDRKAQPREPITAKLMADLITRAGANRAVAFDIHASQIQGFFDIPFDDVWAFPIFADYFKRKKLKDMVVVSPDAGGIKRAVHLSKHLDCPVAMVHKRREKPNEIAEMKVIGDIVGKTVVLYDDIIDTGGTICTAADILKKRGAERVYICCTHPVFSRDAVSRLNASCAEEVLVTDTIPVKNQGKIRVLSISGLIAMAVKNIYSNKSVSTIDRQFNRSMWKNG